MEVEIDDEVIDENGNNKISLRIKEIGDDRDDRRERAIVGTIVVIGDVGNSRPNGAIAYP